MAVTTSAIGGQLGFSRHELEQLETAAADEPAAADEAVATPAAEAAATPVVEAAATPVVEAAATPVVEAVATPVAEAEGPADDVAAAATEVA